MHTVRVASAHLGVSGLRSQRINAPIRLSLELCVHNKNFNVALPSSLVAQSVSQCLPHGCVELRASMSPEPHNFIELAASPFSSEDYVRDLHSWKIYSRARRLVAQLHDNSEAIKAAQTQIYSAFANWRCPLISPLLSCLHIC